MWPLSFGLIETWTPSAVDFIAGIFDCSVSTLARTISVSTLIVGSAIEICFLGFLVVSWYIDHVVDHLFDIFDMFSWEAAGSYTCAFYGLALVAMFSFLVQRAATRGKIGRKLGLNKGDLATTVGFACLFLFVANVTLALGYYSYVYTPEGTYKPPWTENLG
jgi:hypothetical protein